MFLLREKKQALFLSIFCIGLASLCFTFVPNVWAQKNTKKQTIQQNNQTKNTKQQTQGTAKNSSVKIKQQTVKIVVLGDSIAAGYGVAKENAYPAIMEKLLLEKGHKVKVVNAGISGSTTASAFSRLKWQLRGSLQILLLELGGNDGLRGLDLKVSEENLSKTIKLAKEKNIKVLLAGMELPKNYGKKYRSQFSAIFPKLAKQHQVVLMPFLLKDVGAVKKYNLADGIHPNESGHIVIAKNLIPFIEKLL